VDFPHLLQYGNPTRLTQASRIASSFYLKLNGVVAEHRLSTKSRRVLAKFLLNRNNAVCGLGLATYDNDDRILSERFLIGSAPFSDVFTIPRDLEEVAATSYHYSLGGLYRTEILIRQQGEVLIKTITYDSHANPLQESVRTDTPINGVGDYEQVTDYVYEYDESGNWTERVITLQPHLSSGDCVVSATRHIDYF
jgi:hypothetical protein